MKLIKYRITSLIIQANFSFWLPDSSQWYQIPQPQRLEISAPSLTIMLATEGVECELVLAIAAVKHWEFFINTSRV